MSEYCCGPKTKREPHPSLQKLSFGGDYRSSLTALCLVFLVLAAGASLFLPHSPILAKGLGIVSVVFGSVYALQGAWESISAKSLDVNLLMILAAVGAVALGDFFEAAGLLFLFSLSGTLESYAMSKTKSAIESLIQLRPSEALLVEGDIETRVPVTSLRVGDLVKVLPFSSFPTDGTIVTGETSLDQSAMTGESRQIPASVGDSVLAGTSNMDGLVTIKVGAEVGGSTLDKIVALVEEAQEHKASGEKVSKWFGERYTIFVLVSFAASLVVRYMFVHQTMYVSVYESLTLLVGMSPCALVISTPATTLSALAWAARHGILIRGGEFIEKAGATTKAIFDKTGTLTEGKPALVEVCVCSEPVATADGTEEKCWMGRGHMSDEASDVVRYAWAAEKYASHPLAIAIQNEGIAQKLDSVTPDEANVVPGRGIRAVVQGKEVLVGTKLLLEQYGLEVPESMRTRIAQMQGDGLTASFVSVDGHVAALGFVDRPRSNAKSMVEALRNLGVKQVMILSGDNQPTVEAVSQTLGIDSPRGGLLPQDKQELVVEAAKSDSVMMVGDGVNDAPSLAAATVGVAMGGLGSDIALNAADIVLMKDDLNMIPTVIKLGRRTNRIVKGNLFFAAGVVCVLTVLSLFGHLPLIAAVLGHEGSTVLVILSGLRLLSGP